MRRLFVLLLLRPPQGVFRCCRLNAAVSYILVKRDERRKKNIIVIIVIIYFLWDSAWFDSTSWKMSLASEQTVVDQCRIIHQALECKFRKLRNLVGHVLRDSEKLYYRRWCHRVISDMAHNRRALTACSTVRMLDNIQGKKQIIWPGTSWILVH